MSAYAKGTRKPKPSVVRNIKIGGLEIPFSAAIIALLAALYLVLLAGSRMEAGADALMLEVASFVIFALFAYSVRKGILRLKPFIKIIDIFLGLSLIPIVWELAQFFYLYDSAKPADASWLNITGAVNLVLSIAIVIMILYYEKDRLSEVFVKPGNIKSGLIIGVLGLLACAVLALIGVYFFYHSAISDVSASLPALAALCAFGLTGALAEELWFRGLLLSKLIPLVGADLSLFIQTGVFVIFEAIMAFTLMPNALFALIVLAAAALPGYYWGRITIENDSILASTLFHAGFYVLVAMPLFFSAFA
jgi:hypothetical protein